MSAFKAPAHAGLDEILGTQRPSGAFPSTVALRGGARADENAFITALVTLELLPYRRVRAVRAACRRALDFLLSCEAADRPGAFCFYPRTTDQAWMGEGERLPPDVDDSALCALALVRAGRRRAPFARRVLDVVLRSQRLRRVSPAGPAWLRPGVYATWLSGRRAVNPVDVCVNVNIITLIAEAGLQAEHPAAPMVAMIEEAMSLAEARPSLWPQVLPYYPHPRELCFALRRAVAAGARELEPALARAERAPWSRADELAPVCSSMGGLALWTSAPLALARRHAVRRAMDDDAARASAGAEKMDRAPDLGRAVRTVEEERRSRRHADVEPREGAM